MGESKIMFFSKYITTALLISMAVSGQAIADDLLQPETIEVIGITPTHGVGLPETRIPYNVQSASSADLDRSQSLDISDLMIRNLGSVSVNESQENPLQPDIQYRGYTASPLLGLPQGLAIYQNSVRVNEVLGDTINWDLIPESSIASINLIGGANPLFGLNTLGGALSITTKNGFTHPGNSLEAYGGSFGRVVTTAESGGNNGTLGYYATLNYFDEDGWRDFSPSDAINFFTALSYRNGLDTTFDLTFNYADTFLTGNGPIPADLLNRDREEVFTFPDITENTLAFIDLEGEHWLSDTVQLSGNIFYRNSDADYFNGNESIFEDCAGLLCEEGDVTPVTDENGATISSTNTDGSPRDAINNIDARKQRGYGGSLQSTFLHRLFDHDNQLIVGSSYSQGFASFLSKTEIASLNSNRSTSGAGIFVPDEGTFIDTQSRSWSIYLTNTLSLTDKLDLTVSARYNNTGVKITDQGGQSLFTVPRPALNGEHDYERINPAVGATYAFIPGLSGYMNYSESSRAPTPIELACADPDEPCTLPNAFLADPPLDQVVTTSWEGGFRGVFQGSKWHVGGFRALNSNDILFISTGGATGNQGFFSNVGETQRLGMELGLSGTWQQLDWSVNYSYIEATYETAFLASSPNHPQADVSGDIQVSPGDHIPGIPAHNFKVGGDYLLTHKLRIGADLIYNSGVYFRGDEANLLDTIDGYATVNVRSEYQFNKNLSIFARINNLFDTEYETFGLLGDASDVAFNPPLDGDPRFLSPGAPISGFIGIKFQM
jgi:outer membrane receptor protein involved in Fe transport